MTHDEYKTKHAGLLAQKMYDTWVNKDLYIDGVPELKRITIIEVGTLVNNPPTWNRRYVTRREMHNITAVPKRHRLPMKYLARMWMVRAGIHEQYIDRLTNARAYLDAMKVHYARYLMEAE